MTFATRNSIRHESATGTTSPQLTFSSLRRFLTCLEGIRDTLNIENDGHTSQSPFEHVMLRLQLRRENEGLSSSLSLIDRANIDTLLLLVTYHDSTTEHNRNNTEVLLRLTLFKPIVIVPPCTFDLEPKDEGTITLRVRVDLPIHLLLNVRLDVQLIELKRLFTRHNLLDCSQERSWVIKPIQECDRRLLLWTFLPSIELLKSLLDVIKP